MLACDPHRKSYFTKVHKDVLQRSIPAQVRQLILYIRDNEGSVDGFVGELTSAKQLYNILL